MCGIAGFIGEQAVQKTVAMLEKLEYRGYDSAGVASIQECGLDIRKDIGFLHDVVTANNIDKLRSQSCIGHVRWATHGAVSKSNAHPFADCSNTLAVVHNGIISNYNTLRTQLEPKHRFSSDTDSEVIAHLIEQFIEESGLSPADALQETVSCLEGSFAIVVLTVQAPNYFLLAKRNSPLVVGWSKQGVSVASDYLALGDVDRVLDIPEESVLAIDRSVHGAAIPCPEYIRQSKTKGNYAHYMLSEIYEQPTTFATALNQNEDEIAATAMDILRSRDVAFTACGTSRFAALVGRFLFSELANKMSEVIVGSEFQHFAQSLGQSSSVIAISQSGETADVINGIEKIQDKTVSIISIVNRMMSRLQKISDRTLFMMAGPEVGVAATKTFTCELAVLYLLARKMGNKPTDELQRMPDVIKQCLSISVEDISKKLAKSEHIYYVARGLSFAVAGECSLKMKEVSYIHSESMSAGELKHGTLALIEKGTPVIGMCPNDNTYSETLISLEEAKSRGAFVIGISDRKSPVFDHHIEIPAVGNLYYPVPLVIIGQLLAYYVAVARGLSPDFPRSLAKSVTVL